MGASRYVVWGVLAGLAILYLAFLSSVGIFDPEEGRHVSVATEMIRSGDLVVPRLSGFPYLEKPPLSYWMIAGAYRALGRNELASRLPVALMGLAGIAAVFLLTRAVLNVRAALAAAIVLALSTQWFAQSRYMTTDSIVSGWIAIALAAYFAGFHARRRAAYLLFFAAMGMAVLAKGIIGVALPCGVVAAFIAATRRWRAAIETGPVLGAAVFLAVVVPWFVLVQRRVPEFLHYFVFDQHVARFLGTAQEHPAPLWFFLPVLAFGFLPWIMHLPAAVSKFKGPPEFRTFLVAWFAVIFVFFSVSKEKLMGYILPVYPPLAILVGAYLASVFDSGVAEDTVRRVCRAAYGSGAVLLLLAPVFVLGLRRFMAQDGRLSMSEIGPWPWELAAVFVASGAAQIVLAWRRSPRWLLAVAGGGQVLVFLIFIGGAAAADAPLGTRPVGSALAKLAAPDDAIVLYRMPEPSVEYYVGRAPLLYDWVGEHEWGMKIRPNAAFATNDPIRLKALLESTQRVWVVTRAEDHDAPARIGAALQFVMGNRKRALYCNQPVETR